MPLASLSAATIAALVIGSAATAYITYQVIAKIDRSQYIIDHDWLDNILPFVMLVPGVAIGLIIAGIAHFVPSLEVGIPFIITVIFGLCGGFSAASPASPATSADDDLED